MKFWNLLATSVDSNEDIPYNKWQIWNRKSIDEAMVSFGQLKLSWEAGDYRRVILVEVDFSCDTGVSTTSTIHMLRHPLQKKVIYNKQQKKNVVKEVELPKYTPIFGEPNWVEVHNIFNPA